MPIFLSLITSNLKPLLIILALASLFGFGYYTGYKRASLAYELEKQTAIANAEKSVIIKQTKAESITAGDTNAYEKKATIIDGLYGVDSVRKDPLSYALPGISSSSQRIRAQEFSKQYHLSYKDCDIEEAKLIGLWNWTQEQRSNYNAR